MKMSNTPDDTKPVRFDDDLDKILLVLMKTRKNTTANHILYSGIKQQIQALITEARIDELEKLTHFEDNPALAPTYGYFAWDYKERIAKLKENKK